MPYIKITTTKKVNDDTGCELFKELGKAIELLPGKTEEWLMLSLHDGERMAFRGSTEDCAMVEVELFGKATDSAKSALTAELCRIVTDKIKAPSSRTYVTYREVEAWGYDGENF